MKKRYLLFMWDQYYPSGGMKDCVGDFNTQQEAEKYAADHEPNYTFCRAQIYDTIVGKEVYYKEFDYDDRS